MSNIDLSNYITKTDADNTYAIKSGDKSDLNNYYTKTEVDGKFDKTNEKIQNIDLSNYYTKTDINNNYLTKTDADNTYINKNGKDGEMISFYKKYCQLIPNQSNIFFNKIVPCIVFSTLGIICFGAKDKNDLYTKDDFGTNTNNLNICNLSQNFRNNDSSISDKDRYIEGHINQFEQYMRVRASTSTSGLWMYFVVVYPSSYGEISLTVNDYK